jgi:hypothetical protein
MLLMKLKIIRAAVIGTTFAVIGRLLIGAGETLGGHLLYTDPASFFFRLVSILHVHLPMHVGGILGLIWTALFWTAFVWLIHRFMH